LTTTTVEYIIQTSQQGVPNEHQPKQALATLRESVDAIAKYAEAHGITVDLEFDCPTLDFAEMETELDDLIANVHLVQSQVE